MANETPLIAIHPQGFAPGEIEPVQKIYALAKRIARFAVHTVPALLALNTAKAGADLSPCWIAEAIYGADDMRTHLVRAWLIGDFSKTRAGKAVVGFYRLVGRQTAWFVRRSDALKSLFKPLFDRALDRALRPR